MEATGIVVGVDGSHRSFGAVRWAAQEAQRQGTSLKIVNVYEWDWPAGRRGSADVLREWAAQRADETLDAAVEQAHDAAPTVTVERAAVHGDPVWILLDAAATASLVVVGNRGRGGFGSLLLGSVGQRLATHAPAPVVVVRGRLDEHSGPVVVGLDGSASSLDALALAFKAAAERRTSVVAVRAYQPPLPPWGPEIEPIVYDAKAEDAHLHSELDALMAPWRDKFPGVATETLVAHGSAAKVLVDLSSTAQLVAVGTRGHGDVAATLLGSVGLQLLHHAHCPVLIARPRR